MRRLGTGDGRAASRPRARDTPGPAAAVGVGGLIWWGARWALERLGG